MDTATTEFYTLSLHDALPISGGSCITFTTTHRGSFVRIAWRSRAGRWGKVSHRLYSRRPRGIRSEEHTSELQSLTNLVCRLLLEKKKRKQDRNDTTQDTERRI